ncbi:uroporphyrinogen-III synthase [Methanocaldococcus infernus]
MNVIVTRPEDEAKNFCQLLTKKGYSVIKIPCLEIRYKKVKINLDNYDIIAFTSPRGVKGLYLNLSEDEREKVKEKIIACIGEKTAKKVEELFKKSPEIVPSEYRAEKLLEELKKVEGKILIPTTRATRDVLRVLHPTYIYVYESLEPENLKEKVLSLKNLDTFIITFTSGLIAENFLKYVDEELKKKIEENYIIAIGPVTAERVKRFGLNPIVAKKYTIEGILEAIERVK